MESKTKITETIKKIVSQLLPTGKKVELDESLNHYRLSSLKIVKLWLALKDELGADFGMEYLIGEGTLNDLIAHLSDESEVKNSDQTIGSENSSPATEKKSYPLTDIQQSYFVNRQDLSDPEAVGCLIYREFRLVNPDVKRLKEAWQRVVAHQDMLRMRLDNTGRQVIHPSVEPWDLSENDWSNATKSQFNDNVKTFRQSIMREGIKGKDWPLFKIAISHGSDNRSVVHLCLDGLLTDGEGISLLLHQWWQCYENPNCQLPKIENILDQCFDELGKQSASSGYQTSLDYWVNRLDNMPEAPAIFSETASQSAAPEGTSQRQTYEGQLSATTWSALCDKASALGVSPTAYVMTLFSKVLHDNSDKQPFSLVLTTSQRPWLPEEAKEVVGPFTGSLVFVVDSSQKELPEAAVNTNKQLWSDLSNSTVDGVAAMRELRRRTDQKSAKKLPIVFTSLLDTESETMSESGFISEICYEVGHTTGVYLEHQMWQKQGKLTVRWNVAEHKFPAGLIPKLFAQFMNRLEFTALPETSFQDRQPNELQQSYIVDKSTGENSEGCQIYQTVHVEEFSPERLRQAVIRWIKTYDPLRTVITKRGELRLLSETPENYSIPFIDLTSVEDQASFFATLRQEMVGQSFAINQWPMFDIRVTSENQEKATIHLAIDLTLADAVSIRLLCRELFRIYEDQEADIFTPMEYEEFQRAQQGLRSSPAFKHWLSYWPERLKNLHSGPSLLPIDERPKKRDRIRLEGTLVDWPSIKKKAHDFGLSPDALLSTVFGSVLARFQQGKSFTLPVVRWMNGFENYRPGEFTALSWINFEDSEPASSALSLVERAGLIQLLFDSEPSAAAVTGLQTLRKLVMQNRRDAHFELPVVYTSLFCEEDPRHSQRIRQGQWMTNTPNVSLDAIAVEQNGQLQYFWDAVEGDFRDGELRAMFAGFQRVLDSLLFQNESWHSNDLSEQVPLPEHLNSLVPNTIDRETMLYEWNNTKKEFPAEQPAYTRFEKQAELFPNAIALRHKNGTVTYGELNRHANQIAWFLKDIGVGPEAIVTISIAPSPLMVATVFGILKAGGAYLPLDPLLPIERKEVILKESDSKHLLIERGNASLFAGLPCAVHELAPSLSTFETSADHNPPVCTTPLNTAYIIYTSGSTGVPKGVMVTHRPLLNLLHWCDQQFHFNSRDTGLAVASLGFDLSVFDLFGLLGNGGSLYLADDTERKDPSLLLNILLDHRITFWNSSPAVLHQLAGLLSGYQKDYRTKSLRLVFLSGDFTPLSLPDELRATFPNAKMVNLGGATEATVWSNYFPVEEIDPEWRSIPYGVPIDNARYHILDESLEPVPCGVEGDLYIGGDCLSLGYWNQPGLTAKSFIPDPFSKKPGERLYKTGDRAAYLPDGNMTFIGRNDGQVKIRGNRVELGEIEHSLRSHPAIKDVVVLAREDHTGDRKLVAYVIAYGKQPAVGELRNHAGQSLPAYMVPNFVCFIDQLPSTSNGKLDRKALPWPIPRNDSQTEKRETTTKKSSPNQKDLISVVNTLFTEQLGCDDIPVDQDLWNLGATSFTMIQISNALQERYDFRVPVAALIEDPSVKGIARFLFESLNYRGSEQETDPQQENKTIHEQSVEKRTPKKEETTQAITLDLFDREAVQQFKRSHRNVRTLNPSEGVIRLSDEKHDASYYNWRATKRSYEQKTISADDFSRFLALLRKGESNDEMSGNYLYPSAGNTYAVQAYLYLRKHAVEGLDEGIYYYDALRHQLRLIESSPVIEREQHYFSNRDYFDESSFTLYLIGQLEGIKPLYAEQSEFYLSLEAGYMGQLLMMGQAAANIGLCAIGAMNFDKIRPQFQLNEGHVYLHSFLGGPVPAKEFPQSNTLPFFSQPVEKKVEPTVAKNEEIAIVGLAGRYPSADTPDQLWQLLKSGKRAIGPYPAERIVSESFTEIEGGFLTDVDKFDHLLFHITPREAKQLDPQTRLLLQCVWECLENAGYTADSLKRKNGKVGVFIAVMWHDYHQTGGDQWQQDGAVGVAGLGSDLVNRVSHYFDFKGPSIAVNTSCSSSLTALHLAEKSIQRGDCDAAVVGAVNLVVHPYHAGLLSGLQLLGENDSPKAFDTTGKGWTLGEGCAVMLLKPYQESKRDGDSIHGILESTWSAHSGRVARFGAPDSNALARSISKALDQANLTPADIDYVECAAAGAGLADTAELEALETVFGENRHAVPVGTIKPNIGHLEAAAGLSQLTRVLLQMRHDEVSPTLVAEPANRLFSLNSQSIRVVEEPEPWNSLSGSTEKRALINALGATGSYCHVVLRSPTVEDQNRVKSETNKSAEPRLMAIPLSAATDEQLQELALNLLNRCSASENRVSGQSTLEEIAFTLQLGRVAMEKRLALLCFDMDGLIEGLDAFLAGKTNNPVKTGFGDPIHSQQEYQPINVLDAIDYWLKGYDVHWERLWKQPARRVPLPTYPFAAVSHWLETSAVEASPANIEQTPSVPAPSKSPALDYVMDLYSRISGIPMKRLNPHTPLEHYGLSSLLITELNEALSQELGKVSKTLFFEYQELGGIAKHLAANHTGPWNSTNETRELEPLGKSDPDSSNEATRPKAEKKPTTEANEIAIIGIAGRYPEAADIDRFWKNLEEGKDCVKPLPASRIREGWPQELMWGSFLDDVEHFDPLFFNITPRDAELMDPQARIFLETVWKTLEDAGYGPERLRQKHDSNCGVFVGAMYSEYSFFGVEASLQGAKTSCGSALADIANRVSWFLNIHGPSMTLDTMCSASLTAIHLASESLKRGECSVAIAGGVNLNLHPDKFITLDRLKMASSDHRCRSFGADGDGFVPGEGVGAILLKPLNRALEDGDRVHALIKGTAINHGGKTNGYMVPNPQAQGALIFKAMKQAGVSPSTIGYLEAHGTGTSLGDPIEINGLTRAFSEESLPQASCAIGSIKSGIGHLEAAAGIAGLTKLILQMKHGKLAPSIHAERLNSNIDWETTPFQVQRELADWPKQDNQPYRAGISSFGAGGSNGHIILESFESLTKTEPSSRVVEDDQAPRLILLSARNEGALEKMVLRLSDFIATRMNSPQDTEPLNLADIAFTLQVGREELVERFATIVSTPEMLLEHLKAFSEGENRGIFRGRVATDALPTLPPDSGSADELLKTGAWDTIAQFWVEGGSLQWETLYEENRPSIISLPGYPFASMRCWLKDEAQRVPAAPKKSGIPLWQKHWVHHEEFGQKSWDAGKVICLFHQGTETLATQIAEALGQERVLLIREGGQSQQGYLAYETVNEAIEQTRSLLNHHETIRGWIDLCDLYRKNDESDGWLARLAMLQLLLANPATSGLSLIHVTVGLQHPVGFPNSGAPRLTGAEMAGFFKTLAAEYRAVSMKTMDTDLPLTRENQELAEQIIKEWYCESSSVEVCYRNNSRLIPELQLIRDESNRQLTPDPGAVYLITGGSGGIGSTLAAELVKQGARKLALMSAGSLPPREEWNSFALSKSQKEAVNRVRKLEEKGVRVEIHSGSLKNSMAVSNFLSNVRQSLGTIKGVIHCAGRGSQGRPAFIHKELNGMMQTLEPKVAGLRTLTQATVQDKLDFFILFSSVSALVPALGAGVADYGAANAFMDYFANHQHRLGRTEFRSINWPFWEKTQGYKDSSAACEKVGLTSISNQEGVEILERAIQLRSFSNLVPIASETEVNGRDLLSLHPVGKQTTIPKKRETIEKVVIKEKGKSDGPQSWLVELFSDMLGIPVNELDPAAHFGDLGVESVMLAELLTAIETETGRSLEPSALLDYSTLLALSNYLDSIAVTASKSEIPAEPSKPLSNVTIAQEEKQDSHRIMETQERREEREGETENGINNSDIAVIGISARFPDAPDTETFWKNLESGLCSIREIPKSRWDVEQYYTPEFTQGKSISKWGGFLDQLEEFDPEYFSMSVKEAAETDPAIRLVLEETVNCLRNAGYVDKELSGQNVGVFMGSRVSNYRRRLVGALGAAGLGGDQNFIAARIAHHLNIHGPNLVVDSACSSALTAIQLACQSLKNGDAEMAIAGGVDLLLDEEPYLEFSEAGALSRSGRCRTFDQSADGFVPGEGCGLILLKPLRKAIKDGDNIRAVIKGIGSTNDGHTMGLTTPNPKAQGMAIRKALQAAGLKAEAVGMIEAHGTGTKIGDPIELRALTDVFRESTNRKGFCAITSVKSNIGHLLSAAGIAGVIKAILSIEKGWIPPTLFCENPNPRFDFQGSPFYPNTRLSRWPTEGVPKIAGISAFGIGGSNVHLLIGEPTDSEETATKRAPLPPQQFNRQRCWLEKRMEPESTTETIAPVETTTSHILKLDFGRQNSGISGL